ncbi:MAG: hypothetical protein CM1200mP3_18880 [Chloroflexota bacterium]|nr:MAG: hypothetical protein CM1200mP3_18880 [Chloroflexota bacterium]
MLRAKLRNEKSKIFYMNIPIQEISRFPSPGMGVPTSFAFSPGGDRIAYLSQPPLAKECYCSRSSYSKDVLIVAPSEQREQKESLDEELRRQRQRNLGLGVTHFAWIDEKTFCSTEW